MLDMTDEVFRLHCIEQAGIDNMIDISRYIYVSCMSWPYVNRTDDGMRILLVCSGPGGQVGILVYGSDKMPCMV